MMTRATIVALLALMFYAGCANIQPRTVSDESNVPLRARLSGPRVAAHQGDLYSFKFNTIAGLQIARDSGADIVEIDLRAAKDGTPVAFHDEHLSLWTHCKGNVRDLSLAELKECRFRLNDERIPTFEEVLVWSNAAVVVNAEFKEGAAMASAIALVEKYNAYEWTYFQVASRDQYDAIRRRDKRVALLLRVRNHRELEDILALNDERIMVIQIQNGFSLDDGSAVARIRSAGKSSSVDAWHHGFAWEIFGPACTKVFDLGIDIAVTNRADPCVKQKGPSRPRSQLKP